MLCNITGSFVVSTHLLSMHIFMYVSIHPSIVQQAGLQQFMSVVLLEIEKKLALLRPGNFTTEFMQQAGFKHAVLCRSNIFFFVTLST